MKKTISTVRMLLPLVLITSGSNILLADTPVWQLVGSAGFGGTGYNAGAKYLTMALDTNSIPYVTFANNGNYDKATVMKYNGNTWEQLGTTLPSYAETFSTSIAINSNGIPYVAYIAPDEAYTGFWANVVRYDGNSWVNVGNAAFGNGSWTNLTIDTNEIPLVAYRDADNGNQGIVKKLNGNSWDTVGSPGLPSNPMVVTDYQNTPYVASRNTATVKKFNGSDWITVGGGNFTEAGIDYCSIAINSKGTPYVAFSDGDNTGKISVMKYNGTSWVPVGNVGFTPTATYNNTSMAIDGSDTPYLAYVDYNSSTGSQKAIVMQFLSHQWSVVGEAGFSSSNVQDISLAINSKGIPYVSYRDGSIYNRATVMYAPSITCAYKNQQDSTGTCIPGTPDPDPGDYPDILDRNYVQGDINEDGNRTSEPGYEGDYPTLCRDENHIQGSYSCPQ